MKFIKDEMELNKGFVTLAVGDECYFKLATNLLRSYRMHTISSIPFAIITDRENEYTNLFDKVVLLEHSHESYLDKIEILNQPPFQRNIFIDADSLVYGDLDIFWSLYPTNLGVSALGNIVTNNNSGWFDVEYVKRYYNVAYSINMHGGIYFFSNDEITRNVYLSALEILKHYQDFGFRMFQKPADEPIIALAMAIHQCKPIDWPAKPHNLFAYYPNITLHKSNIVKGILELSDHNEKWQDVRLLHFQKNHTQEALYKMEVARLNRKLLSNCYIYTTILIINYRIQDFIMRFCWSIKYRFHKV